MAFLIIFLLYRLGNGWEGKKILCTSIESAGYVDEREREREREREKEPNISSYRYQDISSYRYQDNTGYMYPIMRDRKRK